MIEVENLTKIYGNQKAVDDISFSAQKGEVLGFLGPNGAGKSTTMKIITCYVPQTSGKVTVCGYNTLSAPVEVRQKIGYLPEHNPLYKDMYIKEYLGFVASLYKLKNANQRIETLIEMTGLGREQHKLIGALSKGYRQRVGIAQAMMHDPEVLILDEPTSGLDPNQLVEIRALIKQLGKEKTVIFSTHIMQEAQALCDRMVIINKGKIVANDSIDQLQNRIKGQNMLTVAFKEKIEAHLLQKIPGIVQIKAKGPNNWQLFSDKENDIRESVFKWTVENKLTLMEMYLEKHSVEEVFHALTENGKR